MRTMPLAALAALLAAFAAGCEKKVLVSQAPVYWPAHVRTVVVLPFRNLTNDPSAGLALGDAFAEALAARQICQVLTRNDVRDLADEATLQQWLRQDDAALAAHFRASGRVQAVITGTVTAFAAVTTSTPGRQPVTATDPNGAQRVVGYKSVPVPGNSGDVAATVTMLDLGGRVLYSAAAPVRRTITSAGSPPPLDPAACRGKALEEVVAGLAAPFSPVQREVGVKQGESFYTASAKVEGVWKKTHKFDASSAEIILILRLPPSTAGNRFQVVLARKPSKHAPGADVATQDIIWRAEDSPSGLVLRFAMTEMLRSGGPGDYTAKLLANGQVVMHHDFKISPR